MTATTADDLSELIVAHAVHRLHARTQRAVAAAHRAEFEKTGCPSLLRQAWRADELAEADELIERELAQILALAREDRL
jgi:hypothetical protein